MSADQVGNSAEQQGVSRQELIKYLKKQNQVLENPAVEDINREIAIRNAATAARMQKEE